MNSFSLPTIGGNVPAGSIDSSEIADGTIVNADINAAAAIVFTKLAALTAGSIPYADANGFLTQSNANLSYDATNNRVLFGVAAASVPGTVTTSGIYNAGNTFIAGSKILYFLRSSDNALTGQISLSTANLILNTASSGGSITLQVNTAAAFTLDSNRRAIFAAGKRVKVTAVTSGASYAVLVTDYLISVNKTVGSATGITLPATPTTGDQYIVKDAKGDGAANNITVTPSAGTIDGAATHVINANYGKATYIYTGSEWSVI